MKFARDRYQYGSLRRVQRAKGPDVWEFRYSTYENGVRKQRQLTLSSKKYPSEVAVKRKVEGLLLKLNSSTSSAALRSPPWRQSWRFLPERRCRSGQKPTELRLLIDRHIQPKWGSCFLSKIRPHAGRDLVKEMPYSPETKRHIKSMLYRLFELAMKRDWLEAQRNPMSLVRVKGRNRVVEKVVLTPEQMLTVREISKIPIC